MPSTVPVTGRSTVMLPTPAQGDVVVLGSIRAAGESGGSPSGAPPTIAPAPAAASMPATTKAATQGRLMRHRKVSGYPLARLARRCSTLPEAPVPHDQDVHTEQTVGHRVRDDRNPQVAGAHVDPAVHQSGDEPGEPLAVLQREQQARDQQRPHA